jgi:hypothetical protein
MKKNTEDRTSFALRCEADSQLWRWAEMWRGVKEKGDKPGGERRVLAEESKNQENREKMSIERKKQENALGGKTVLESGERGT